MAQDDAKHRYFTLHMHAAREKLRHSMLMCTNIDTVLGYPH